MVAMCNIFKKPWLNDSVHGRVRTGTAAVAWAVSIKRYSKCLCVWRTERDELMCMSSSYWNFENELFYLKCICI